MKGNSVHKFSCQHPASTRGSNRLQLLAFSCLLVVLAACGTDDTVRGTVRLRQLVAIQCEPPEALPDERIQVRTMVADPVRPQVTLEYALIACTAYTGVSGCLEEIQVLDEEDVDTETGEVTLDETDYREYVEQFVVRGRIEPTSLATPFEAEFVAPANYAILLTELGYTQVDASLFMLVCDTGLCPMLDEIDAFLAEAEGALQGSELVAQLSDPEMLTAGAPLEGVALGRKNYKVSLRPERNRNHNPQLLQFDASRCHEVYTSGITNCKVDAELSSDSLEVYTLDPSSSTQTQEAVVMRFYTTFGTISPYNIQIYPSSIPQQSSYLTIDEQADLPDQLGLFAVAVDSRGGMSVISEVLEPQSP